VDQPHSDSMAIPVSIELAAYDEAILIALLKLVAS